MEPVGSVKKLDWNYQSLGIHVDTAPSRNLEALMLMIIQILLRNKDVSRERCVTGYQNCWSRQRYLLCWRYQSRRIYSYENFIPKLNPACGGSAPVISLDSKKYKLVGALEEAIVGGIPSLVNCNRLTVKGLVRMSKKTSFVGDVSVVNSSDESKFIPTGKVEDASLDLTDATGLGPLKPSTIASSPIAGQKPGTSGLRKKTKLFMEEHYLNNFVQASFDAVRATCTGTDVSERSLIIGGDGRYDTSTLTRFKPS